MDSSMNVSSELFTDLDPLGTGKSKPYVDKKDFFSELKSSSPKLGNMSSNNNLSESPVPPAAAAPSMESTSIASNVGLPPDVSLSCPAAQQHQTSTSFVHNSSQRSSLRSSSGGNQPLPPPRSGSELTYGHLDQVSSRRSFTSSDTMPRHIRGFGFSSHLSQPTSSSSATNTTMSTKTNPASNITTMASSWRTAQMSSGIHDTRLYHTLGRPMTTFNRSLDFDGTSSNDSSLRLSMLPDNSQPVATEVKVTTEDPSNTEDNGRYGSIPQLEASPRRYNRLKDQDLYHYDTSGSSLPVPGSGNVRGLPIAEQQELPPKLPEKPSRRTNQSSPPPLPPKKPTTKALIGVIRYTSNRDAYEPPPQPDVVSGHEIYDFPPMPMIGSLKMDKEEAKHCIQDILKSNTDDVFREHEQQEDKISTVSVEELSKMSLIDLNAKMLSGQLPEEMKGMSIVELVDFINESMKRKTEAAASTAIKPSFSDNFVCDNLPKTSEEHQVPNSVSPGPPLSATSKEVGFAFPAKDQPSAPYPLPSSQGQASAVSSGFDDDFTPFSINNASHHFDTNLARPESQATSDHSVLSQSRPDEYDKYAVFRELQMEEELIKAWKTPSDEEKEEVTEEPIEQEEVKHTAEQDEYDLEDQEFDQNHHQPPPVCSSEGSPCSRSDTQSPVKSYSVDEHHEPDQPDEEQEEPEDVDNQHCDLEDVIDGVDDDPMRVKRESQVPIFNQRDDEDEESVTQSIRSAEPKEISEEQDSFFSNNFDNGEPKVSKTWTTFDDGPDELVSSTLRSQGSPAVNYFNKENAFQDNFGDPVDWGSAAGASEDQPVKPATEPVMSRQLSSDSQHSISGKCKRFSHRHVDADHICRGHSTEMVSSETNSYTEWWPPSAEVGAPVKKLRHDGTGNEAYTATPDHKPGTAASSAWGDNAFGDPLEAKFKIFSKVIQNNGMSSGDRSMTPNDPISDNDSGIIPKSDSINIFSIKDDPFDDDFFH